MLKSEPFSQLLYEKSQLFLSPVTMFLGAVQAIGLQPAWHLPQQCTFVAESGEDAPLVYDFPFETLEREVFLLSFILKDLF